MSQVLGWIGHPPQLVADLNLFGGTFVTTRRVSGGATAAPALLEQQVREALRSLASQTRRMGCPEGSALLLALERLCTQVEGAAAAEAELATRRDYAELTCPVIDLATRVREWAGEADAARTLAVQADALAIRVHAVLVR